MTRRISFLVVSLMLIGIGCGSSGYSTTPTGLQYKITAIGNGSAIQNNEVAIVHYTGWLYDASAENERGNKFDSSVDRNEPLQFQLGTGRVIRGWEEGILGMKVGEKRTLIIPPDLGYGSRSIGDAIPPNSTLIFDVELMDIGQAQ